MMIISVSNPPLPLDTLFSLQSSSQMTYSGKSNISILCFIFAVEMQETLFKQEKNYHKHSPKMEQVPWKDCGDNGDVQKPAWRWH